MQAILVFWGIISAPITASLFYMGIVAAMGFELSYDMFRTAELSEELRESDRRRARPTLGSGCGTSRAMKSGLRTSPAPGRLGLHAPVDVATKRGDGQDRFHLLA